VTNQLVNRDGVSEDEITAALRVIDNVADDVDDPVEARSVLNTRMLVEEYRANSIWHNPKPSDKTDSSDYQTLDTFEIEQ